MKYRNLFISTTPDVYPNEGGYYCSVYSDESMDNQVDDFVIHVDELDTNPSIEYWIRINVDNFIKWKEEVKDMEKIKLKENVLFNMPGYEIVKGDLDYLEITKVDREGNKVGETVEIPPQNFAILVEAYAWDWNSMMGQAKNVLANKKFWDSKQQNNVVKNVNVKEQNPLENVDFHGLLSVLDDYDKHLLFNSFTTDNWTIVKGADFVSFDVYYCGLPVAQCKDGVLSSNIGLKSEDKAKLLNTITNVLDYVRIEKRKGFYEIHVSDGPNDGDGYSVFVDNVRDEDEALKKAVNEGLLDKTNFLKVDYIDEISNDEYLICTADFVGNAKAMFEYMSDEYETVNEWKELFYELVADFVLDDEFESIKDIKEKLYELVSDERLEEYILQSSYVNKLENGEFAFNGDTASLANKMKEAEGRSGNAVNRDVYGLSKIDEPVR